jgi:hypothetical protein
VQRRDRGLAAERLDQLAWRARQPRDRPRSSDKPRELGNPIELGELTKIEDMADMATKGLELPVRKPSVNEVTVTYIDTPSLDDLAEAVLADADAPPRPSGMPKLDDALLGASQAAGADRQGRAGGRAGTAAGRSAGGGGAIAGAAAGARATAVECRANQPRSAW